MKHKFTVDPTIVRKRGDLMWDDIVMENSKLATLKCMLYQILVVISNGY